MSESNKFTPGPWEVVEDIRYEDKESQYTAGFDICNFDGTSVVGCEGISGDSEKERANAILIAAAPDLLEALEGVLRISDLWLPHEVEEQHGEEMYVLHMARNKMIAAVEKARGQQ